jgi:hypothetical protein
MCSTANSNANANANANANVSDQVACDSTGTSVTLKQAPSH